MTSYRSPLSELRTERTDSCQPSVASCHPTPIEQSFSSTFAQHSTTAHNLHGLSDNLIPAKRNPTTAIAAPIVPAPLFSRSPSRTPNIATSTHPINPITTTI